MKGFNTRKWTAYENNQPPGPVKVQVAGEVETSSAHKLPKLVRAVPQGINPKILILNLTVVETGKTGPEVVAFRPATYDELVDKGQFTQVQINCEGSMIQLIDVEPIF